MGISVTATDEFGNATSKAVWDPKNHLHRLLELFPHSKLLQYIDWYGITLINQLQMRDFISEWELMYEFTEDADERELLKKIQDLAESIVGHPHNYLKFEGD